MCAVGMYYVKKSHEKRFTAAVSQRTKMHKSVNGQSE